MDFHPGTAAAATTDVVDVPAADAAAVAVTSEVVAASLFPSASLDPSASTLPPIAAPAVVSATSRNVVLRLLGALTFSEFAMYF